MQALESTASRASWLDLLRGTWAISQLTLREVLRQRLWLLVLLAALGILLVVPRLQAVDEASQLKLAVSAVSGVIGFLTILLAVFIMAVTLRRDLESRSSFLLFSKPLPRLAYCLGRWLGTVISLGFCVALLSLAGVLAIAIQRGSLPQPQYLQEPSAWLQIDALGGERAVRDDQHRILMDQALGAGVQVRFSGLNPAGEDLTLLLKAQVRSPGMMRGHSAPIQMVSLYTDAAGYPQSRLLALSPESPLGHRDPSGEVVVDGHILLIHRARERRDLDADYLRFDIPAGHIADDGSLLIQLLRGGSESAIIFTRDDSFLLARDGQHFVIDLFKAGLVYVAHAALLASLALCLGMLAGIGPALLGCLTFFFGGHAASLLAEVTQSPQTGQFARRLLDLLLPLIPDFSRFPVAAQLAAAHSISWATIGQAWSYFGLWMLACLFLGWRILAMREL